MIWCNRRTAARDSFDQQDTVDAEKLKASQFPVASHLMSWLHTVSLVSPWKSMLTSLYNLGNLDLQRHWSCSDSCLKLAMLENFNVLKILRPKIRFHLTRVNEGNMLIECKREKLNENVNIMVHLQKHTFFSNIC